MPFALGIDRASPSRSGRQGLLAIGGDGEVHRLEALELLVVALWGQIAGGDVDGFTPAW
jgi:hypothetical protein